MKLLSFDFTIIYKAEKENQEVDALSRRPQYDNFLALAILVYMDFLNLQEALLNDPYTKKIITSIRQDPTTHPEFSLSDNKLFYLNRLCYPGWLILTKIILANDEERCKGSCAKLLGYHTSSKTKHFKFVYGRDLPPLNLYVQDSKRRELSFEVGDVVLLRIQPFRQCSLSKRKFEKLPPWYFRPYIVTRRLGPVAYELSLPADSKAHHIFHVFLLRRVHSQAVSQPSTHLPITADWEQILVSDKILTHRWIPQSNNMELLV
nr:hypothetical protein [Tanacetum cinerariifolium]GEY16226.1 hypothetical protein [Tanacetum cinerariifolium]